MIIVKKVVKVFDLLFIPLMLISIAVSILRSNYAAYFVSYIFRSFLLPCF